MKYYIIAGEASGDLHGSGLMKELKRIDPAARFRFWGGDLMVQAGGILVKHIRETSYMGFQEVFFNLRSIYANMMFCKRDISQYNPDALILIDYPGFNLRMARFAKKEGIRVFYYISPKVWAWNQSRVQMIKKYVDHMLTIFPFETEFYEKFGYKVDYVGNPLMDPLEYHSRVEEGPIEFNRKNKLSGKPVVSILPGSRIQEIKKSLPVMLSVTGYFQDYQFVIAGAPSIDSKVYSTYTKNDIPVLSNQTYSILHNSSAAMIVSGTATLEAALLGVPLVVCYRGSFLSYHIAKRFIKVKYISLVNLIMGREVVKELIQDEFNTRNLKYQLERLLADAGIRKKMMDDLDDLRQLVGGAGASARAAGKIFRYLKK